MAEPKDDIFDRMEDFQDEIRRMIRDFYVNGNPMSVFSTTEWRPPTDVYETDSELIVRMEIAGMAEKDIGVVIEGDKIAIFGKREDLCRKEATSFRQMEVKYTQFHRSLLLPTGVNENKVKATYVNGFLEIRIAKESQVKKKTTAVKIEVRG